MHRLTQAVVRDGLGPDKSASARTKAEAVLAATTPGEPLDPSTWQAWARVIPHVLAADLAGTSNPDLRLLACAASLYLIACGDTGASEGLTSSLYERWRHRMGEDHPQTLASASNLAVILRQLGDLGGALDLCQDALTRRSRVLGEEHPDTLASANNLAVVLRSLGALQDARQLSCETLATCRSVLGEDHPHTLISADNLAKAERALAEADNDPGSHRPLLMQATRRDDPAI